jgi:hypothetical protein
MLLEFDTCPDDRVMPEDETGFGSSAAALEA